MFIRKIMPHGNSLTVGIPANVCRDLKLKRGDFLVGTIDKDLNIVLGKMKKEAILLKDNELENSQT